jgi:hypothetical protein
MALGAVIFFPPKWLIPKNHVDPPNVPTNEGKTIIAADAITHRLRGE